jgi:hypothetical protein
MTPKQLLALIRYYDPESLGPLVAVSSSSSGSSSSGEAESSSSSGEVILTISPPYQYVGSVFHTGRVAGEIFVSGRAAGQISGGRS